MLRLKELGHTPIAIAPEGAYLQKIRDAGIQTISYEISRKSLNPFKEIVAIKNIHDAIKPLNLDILHSFTAKPNIYGTIAGKMAGVPKIYNLVEGLGSFYLEEDFKSKAIRGVIEMLYKIIFAISDGVMFVNSSDPEYFVSQGIIDSAKVHKINGVGIDTNEWLPIQKEQLDDIKIMMVARAIKHKGALEFIEAAKILTAKYPNVKFIYIGAPDSGNPSSLSEEFMQNEQSIVYLGERDDVKRQLSTADIFVLPSYREGLPRTVLEAMSLGIAVVATNAPGCKDSVTDGKNGLLVPIKDSIALANAIEKLILDKNLRDTMGENGRKMAVEQFDIKPIVAKHLELYNI
jgi:N,N'-diacetylbacillosaminyl-diphospho-undecaprenol alpha-1,3-N-acetylgalactosaminyltransferase